MLPNGSIKYLSSIKKCQRKKIVLTSTHLSTRKSLAAYYSIYFPMLCKSCPIPPTVGVTIFMPLVELWIVQCNLPITSPCSSITLMTQRLPTCLFFRTLDSFWNVNRQPIVLLELEMYSSFHLLNVSIESLFLQELKYFCDGRDDGLDTCTHKTVHSQ